MVGERHFIANDVGYGISAPTGLSFSLVVFFDNHTKKQSRSEWTVGEDKRPTFS